MKERTTLEGLLRGTFYHPTRGDEIKRRMTPNFVIAVQVKGPDGVHIIVQADRHASDKLDFLVTGNELTPI